MNALSQVDPGAAPRGLKRKMSGYALRPRKRCRTTWLPMAIHIKILK